MTTEKKENLPEVVTEPEAVLGGTRPILAGLVAVIPYAGSGLVAWYQSRAAESQERRFQEFVEEVTNRLTSLENQDTLDEDFLGTEEFHEAFDEVARRAVQQRSQEKRAMYAALLAGVAHTGSDRDWFPTGLQLLDRVEPVHVEILDILSEWQREDHGESSGLDSARLAKRLWKDLNAEDPDEVQVRRHQVLEHVWYLGGIGLLGQIGEDRAEINRLSEKFLGWIRRSKDG